MSPSICQVTGVCDDIVYVVASGVGGSDDDVEDQVIWSSECMLSC